VASASETGTGTQFAFDRLGVRVPGVLVSPWIAKRSIIPGVENHANGRIFEHASIPATVTKLFIGDYEARSPREKAAETFLDLFGDFARPDSDCPVFSFADDDSQKRPDEVPRLASNKVQAFLCYASSDKELVRKLYRDLLRDGIDPWLDEEKLLPGHDWDLEIRSAMAKSGVVVVCLSRNSVTRTGYVQKEIRQALDLADQRPQGAIFLIPAKLEDCPIPERLAHLQYVELFRGAGYAKLLKSIDSTRSPR
jgi:hypothetical protein